MVTTDAPPAVRPRTRTAAGWLLAGGVLFFAGGPMHPHDDPPGASVKEHLRVMFENPAWYPAHAVLFAGLLLMAVGLVLLVRDGGLTGTARRAAVFAAVATCVAAPAMLLHLVAALDADRIAAHHGTPLTNVQVAIETVTVPLFSAGVVALAVVGAATRTVGNWLIAAPAVLGGVGYALAGATFLVTDALDPLFPAAAGLAVWAIAAAGWLLVRHRSPRPVHERFRSRAGLR